MSKALLQDGYALREIQKAVKLFNSLEETTPIYIDISAVLDYLDIQDKRVFEMYSQGFIYKEIGNVICHMKVVNRKDTKEVGRTAVRRLVKNLERLIFSVNKGAL